jgi:ABC-type multidrug transport system ATPase subunit
VVLSATGVSFAYNDGRTIVDGLTIDAGAGAVLVVGDNGAGKSTLGRLLCGLLEPSAGTVTIQGRDVHACRGLDRYRLAAYMPQRTQTYLMWSSVREEVHFSMRHLPIDRRERESRAEDLFSRYALADVLDRNPADLSFSEAWRLVFVLCVLGRPALLYVDESLAFSSGLARRLFTDALRDRAAQGLLTMVTVHRPVDYLEPLAQHVIRL